MARTRLNYKIDDFFERARWDEARELLEAAREKAPEDHWVLTQLGVTFYEQRQYRKALKLFLASLKVVPDCPLTLWNLAGTLDALGKPAEAVRVYTWLLRSEVSPAEDPCWESREWADALKTDCVYRLGVCFQHLGKKDEAERCYREYVNLLLSGADGTFSLDDVAGQIRGLHGGRRRRAAGPEVRSAMASALHALEMEPTNGHRPPRFDESRLQGRAPAKGRK